MIGDKTIFLLLLGIIIVAWIGVSIAKTIEMKQEEGTSTLSGQFIRV